MTRIGLSLLLWAVPLQAQDGARYPVPGGPFAHVLLKGAVSAGTYTGLHRLGLGKPASAVLASVGVWTVAKGLELAKGHRLGPWDTVHDLGWHLLGVSLVRGKHWRLETAGLTVGIVLTRCASSPRWGC